AQAFEPLVAVPLPLGARLDAGPRRAVAGVDLARAAADIPLDHPGGPAALCLAEDGRGEPADRVGIAARGGGEGRAGEGPRREDGDQVLHGTLRPAWMVCDGRT